MTNLSSVNDIEKISFEILKDSKALDVYPTPIDKIVQYTELYVDESIDLSNPPPSLGVKFNAKLKSALGKLRGFLDRRDKTIYLDLSQNYNRKGFVKLHEVGHNALPWQRMIMEYLDDDSTLDPTTKEEFEAEANFFASGTLFQHDRFLHQIKKYPLEISTPMHLAKVFGASNHASLRRYVEYTKNRCALLVLENISKRGDFCQCTVRDYFQSENFSKEFGAVKWSEKLGFTWEFVKDYYFGRRFRKDGKLMLETNFGRIDCEYHFFNNSYNAFVLIFPKGEKHKSKYEFIIGP